MTALAWRLFSANEPSLGRLQFVRSYEIGMEHQIGLVSFEKLIDALMSGPAGYIGRLEIDPRSKWSGHMSYYSVEQTVLWRVPAVALLRKFAEQFGVTDSLPDEHVAEAAWKAASNACKEAGYRTERDGKAPHVVSHVMKWKWHNLNLELERAVTAAHALDVHDTTPIHYLGG